MGRLAARASLNPRPALGQYARAPSCRATILRVATLGCVLFSILIAITGQVAQGLVRAAALPDGLVLFEALWGEETTGGHRGLACWAVRYRSPPAVESIPCNWARLGRSGHLVVVTTQDNTIRQAEWSAEAFDLSHLLRQWGVPRLMRGAQHELGLAWDRGEVQLWLRWGRLHDLPDPVRLTWSYSQHRDP